MHPPDCPAWEYENHPKQATIPARVSEILTALATGHMDTLALATNSRVVHGGVFRELTPAECKYYAGHYRGEQFRCLRFYRVEVPADRRVGAPPESVEFRMGE